MKKAIRIIIPIILVLAIILCTAWYLFVYDREFTRDMLLNLARYSESQGNLEIATYFYNAAYLQSGNSDAVAIELANQYKDADNYTKAEYTLSQAIANGGGVDVYIALCKTYVEQDKLLDAVNMLNNITNTDIKAQIEAIRPKAPITTPDTGFYRQYISVSVEAESGTVYATANGLYPSVQDAPYSKPFTLSDGENTIYALVIGENGLVSDVTISGYTVGGVVQLLKFSDSAIEAAVRESLSVPDNADIYTNNLWDIKEFTVPQEAKNYADLQHMIFLEKLTIENGVPTELSNISGLDSLTDLSITNTTVSKEMLDTIAALPALKNLTLSNCGISNIAALEKATSLVTLNLSNNLVYELTPLSGMNQLQELTLSHNTIADLAPLAACKALTKLDISSNVVSTLAPISSLTGLTHLNANTNVITTLGEIGSLQALTELDLSNNQLTDVSALASCSGLTKLNIATNKLTSISKLADLVALMHLDFSYNEVSEIPAFPKDCALVTIVGSNNKISSLSPLSGLQHLNSVRMDYNTEISSVEPLANCPVLFEVNVFATRVTDVTCLTNQSIIVNYNPVQN